MVDGLETKQRELLRAEDEGLWPAALTYILRTNPFNVLVVDLDVGDAKVVSVKPGFKSYSFRLGDMGIETVE